jgi:hypothetical protein
LYACSQDPGAFAHLLDRVEHTGVEPEGEGAGEFPFCLEPPAWLKNAQSGLGKATAGKQRKDSAAHSQE